MKSILKTTVGVACGILVGGGAVQMLHAQVSGFRSASGSSMRRNTVAYDPIKGRRGDEFRCCRSSRAEEFPRAPYCRDVNHSQRFHAGRCCRLSEEGCAWWRRSRSGTWKATK
jgi:hypothetical protein